MEAQATVLIIVERIIFVTRKWHADLLSELFKAVFSKRIFILLCSSVFTNYDFIVFHSQNNDTKTDKALWYNIDHGYINCILILHEA